VLFYGCKGKGWLDLPWSLHCRIRVRVCCLQVLDHLFKAGRNLLGAFSAGWIGRQFPQQYFVTLSKNSLVCVWNDLIGVRGARDPEDIRSHLLSVGKEDEWKLYEIVWVRSSFGSNMFRKSCWIILRMCRSLLS